MTHDSSESSESKQAAKNARLDEPTPPGGSMRQDAPAGHDTPGEEASDPGGDVTRVTRPEEDGDPSTTGEPEQSEAAAELQEENAETTLDQPSQ